MSNPNDLTPPPEVQAILDESDNTGPYGTQFTLDSVRLVDAKTGAVIREVKWPEAGEFARNLLRNSLATVQSDVK